MLLQQPDLPKVRLVLAISLDGKLAPPGGGPAHLGSSGDRNVLEEALAWSDGCLIGAGTLRIHQSTCLIRNQFLLTKRLAEGRSEQPIAVVVSRRPDFSMRWSFFNQPLQRWLLSSNDFKQGFERTIPFASSLKESLNQLQTLGLQRLLLLGGAQLLGSFIAEDLVDEFQFTVTPFVLGGPHVWLPMETQVSLDSLLWNLSKIRLLGDGELLLCYQRRML